jgi:hypothetical protein
LILLLSTDLFLLGHGTSELLRGAWAQELAPTGLLVDMLDMRARSKFSSFG